MSHRDFSSVQGLEEQTSRMKDGERSGPQAASLLGRGRLNHDHLNNINTITTLIITIMIIISSNNINRNNNSSSSNNNDDNNDNMNGSITIIFQRGQPCTSPATSMESTWGAYLL